MTQLVNKYINTWKLNIDFFMFFIYYKSFMSKVNFSIENRWPGQKTNTPTVNNYCINLQFYAVNSFFYTLSFSSLNPVPVHCYSKQCFIALSRTQTFSHLSEVLCKPTVYISTVKSSLNRVF